MIDEVKLHEKIAELLDMPDLVTGQVIVPPQTAIGKIILIRGPVKFAHYRCHPDVPVWNGRLILQNDRPFFLPAPDRFSRLIT